MLLVYFPLSWTVGCLLFPTAHFVYPFKLLGWNVFQREMMSGKQLVPGEWKEENARCSALWSSMTPEEKGPYEAIAAAEQSLRENASHEPFTPKVRSDEQAGMPAADLLSKAASTTVSKQRLLATFSRFRDATEWAEVDAGLFSADGALSLDSIDLAATDTEIRQQWEPFTQLCSKAPKCFNDFNTSQLQPHHTTCFQNHGGLYKQTPHLTLLTKLVHSMADFVSSGSLPLILRR